MDLLYKSFIYLLWYNTIRKNRNKEKKSPVEILKENDFQNAEKIVMFQPIIVDKYVKDIVLIKKGGYFKVKAPRQSKQKQLDSKLRTVIVEP